MAEASPALAPLVADTSTTVAPGTEAISGRFVRLERLQEGDTAALWESVGRHADVWTHWPEATYDEEGFGGGVQFLLHKVPGLVNYAMLLPEDGAMVGVMMLLPVDLKSRVMEIGMVYGPRIRRTRAATEAFYLLSRLAFDELNNRRLQWKTDAMNAPSRRAAERYGLTYEGCLRQKEITRGRNRDEVWYAMLDNEWPACKRAFEAWLDDANFDEKGVQKVGLVDIRKGLVEQENVKGNEN